MSFECPDLAGIYSSKQKHGGSKKRKIETVNVCDEISKNEKSLNAGNDEKVAYQLSTISKRKKRENPTFCLTEHGINAQLNLEVCNKNVLSDQTTIPLFVEDIQRLLLKVMVGGPYAHGASLRWAKIRSVKKISHVVLLIIDGVSKDRIANNVPCFQSTLNIFSDMVEIVAPVSYNLNFATALCSFHVPVEYYSEKQNGIETSPLIKVPSDAVFDTKPWGMILGDSKVWNKGFSKLNLLLNVLQLAIEKFPLPVIALKGANMNNYCFTKQAYSHVTAESPMFALDCEMCCMSSNVMAVTKIAIVDEELNVIYETLVKPKGPILDYLTKYSGVNEEMLQPVTTTLADVQQHLQKLLPPDAILCGHSLNFDLHALNMIHPYIIDTSVIYNISGSLSRKSSLRLLSRKFLDTVIQCSENGHDPVEDSIAVMKLVQLKLKQGTVFGDAILEKCVKSVDSEDKSRIENDEVEDIKLNLELQSVRQSNMPEETPRSTHFFSELQSGGKSICIVSDMLSYPQYLSETLSDSIVRVSKLNMRKTIKKSVKLMHDYDLTVSHINPVASMKNENSLLISLNNYIEKLYNACADKSIFIVAATGAVTSSNCENAVCMVRLKTESK